MEDIRLIEVGQYPEENNGRGQTYRLISDNTEAEFAQITNQLKATVRAKMEETT